MRDRRELEGEAEVDLGRYAAAVAARWWLVLLGLVAGVLVGLLLSVGGEQVYRASALVYLGQPYVGSARVDSLATTPGNVREIVTSEAAVRRVAAEAGLAPGELRGHISVSSPSGAGADRARQQLVNVTVTGEARRKTARAANLLSRAVVDGISGYADAKIATLEGQVDAADQELAALERRIEALLADGDDAAAAVFELRRSTVISSKLDRQQLLELARNVERASVVEPAVARQVTAQSRRNAIVVAGALGLLLGLAAALAWQPVTERVRPRGTA